MKCIPILQLCMQMFGYQLYTQALPKCQKFNLQKTCTKSQIDRYNSEMEKLLQATLHIPVPKPFSRFKDYSWKHFGQSDLQCI